MKPLVAVWFPTTCKPYQSAVVNHEGTAPNVSLQIHVFHVVSFCWPPLACVFAGTFKRSISCRRLLSPSLCPRGYWRHWTRPLRPCSRQDCGMRCWRKALVVRCWRSWFRVTWSRKSSLRQRNGETHECTSSRFCPAVCIARCIGFSLFFVSLGCRVGREIFHMLGIDLSKVGFSVQKLRGKS